MKIAGSQIAMSATHRESSYTYRESATMEAAASQDKVGAILTLSREASGRSHMESMQTLQLQEKNEAASKHRDNEVNFLQKMSDRLKAQRANSQYDPSEDADMKIKMMRRILAMLRGEDVPEDCKIKPQERGNVADLRSAGYRQAESFSLNFGMATSTTVGAVMTEGVGTTQNGTTWQRITATSGFVTESEQTTFASRGIVRTMDGRSIDFNVEVSMTRAFMSTIDTISVEDYIKTDPLVINLDSNVASVTDQKFLFDIDSDGREESISFAGEGSGFLAIDKNNDGKINDGSELFGTKSGDGFADLAEYDEDGNGWIDENDSIYKHLKVWTKDADGKDHLIDLKKADVGAIYLDRADTQYSLKNEDNRLNAEIKKTGIYLHESTGAVGTLNHIDLAI